MTRRINFNTKGNTDIVDITGEVERGLVDSKQRDGAVTVFVTHSTAAIAAIECEPGLLEDFKQAWERIAPRDIPYEHDRGLGEGNGFSHVRASILGPSLTVPFNDRRLVLGTWQQIVLVDFDNRPRSRTVVLQYAGD